MSKQTLNSTHLRHNILYQFNGGSSGTMTANNINETYGRVITSHVFNKWYRRFRSGGLNCEDSRKVVSHQCWTKTLVEEYPKQTIDEIGVKLKCSPGTVWNHLQQIGKSCRSGVWIPHKLSADKKALRISLKFSDNSKITRDNIDAFEWDLLPHPPYSPDIAPSDYHLFRSLKHFLCDKLFNCLGGVEIGLKDFFEQMTPDFYRPRIESLSERWGLVLDYDGIYIID